MHAIRQFEKPFNQTQKEIGHPFFHLFMKTDINSDVLGIYHFLRNVSQYQ